MHRIHHSLQTRHYDRNFAFWFSCIDRMFGTYCPPVADEFPDVGLSDFREPKNLKEYILSLHPIEPPASPATSSTESAVTGRVVDIAA